MKALRGLLFAPHIALGLSRYLFWVWGHAQGLGRVVGALPRSDDVFVLCTVRGSENGDGKVREGRCSVNGVVGAGGHDHEQP